MTPIVSLTAGSLALAAALLVASGVISVAFRLGLERSLLLAGVRMVAQLMLVGIVLQLVFQQTSPLWSGIVALVMIAIAGYEVAARQTYRLGGFLTHGIGTLSLMVVSGLATLYTVLVVIGSDAALQPRYLLTILGMILGNTLTAVALALDALFSNVRRQRGEIETRLALGETALQAMSGVVAAALRTALIPTINSMSVAGIVTLPGMMTGQILAGAPPAEAAMYQAMILFVISGAAGLGAAAATLAAARLLTDDRQRLRLDRLAPT